MKNGDKAAMPVLHTIDGNWVKEPMDQYKGLTKREYFAVMAMQGILSNPNWIMSEAYAAEAAINEADKLLKHLER